MIEELDARGRGWVRRLLTSAQSGVVLDLTTESGADPEAGDDWGVERTIPAAALRTVLTGREVTFDPRGLQVRGALFSEDLELSHVVLSSPLQLIDCRLRGAMIANNATFTSLVLTGSHLRSLILDGATVSGVLGAAGTHAHGTISAVDVRIGGSLVLSGAACVNPGGAAVVLDGAVIGGSVMADGGFNVDGTVHVQGARIGGQLALSGAVLHRPGGHGLVLDGTEIAGSMVADAGFCCDGMIRAVGTHVGVQLNVSGALLRNPGRVALCLDGVDVRQDLHADLGFTVEGTVEARGACVGGQLNLSGAAIINPGKLALSLDGAKVGSSVLAADGFSTQGEFSAEGAHIVGDLCLTYAALDNPAGNALDLEGAQVAGALILGSESTPTNMHGRIVLRRASIGYLVTPNTNDDIPGTLIAAGWQIGDLKGGLRTNWRAARRWLDTAPAGEDATHAWHAMADVYERNGQPSRGRRLRVAAANRVTRNAPWPSKILRTSYLWVAGHGYYPPLAILWLTAIILAGTLIVSSHRGDLIPVSATAGVSGGETVTGQTPCRPHAGYHCLNPLSYTLTELIPTAGTVTSQWSIPTDASSWLTVALPLLKLLAWALTGLLLAGVTGLLKKT